MKTRDVDATKLLEKLINHSFHRYEAMFLVRQGADPNVKNANGKSLLHLLVTAEGDRSIIDELVNVHGADIHLQDSKGRTPLALLMTDAQSFNAPNALHLIQLGADPNTRDTDGFTVLHHLVRNLDKIKHPTIKKLVKTYHADIHATSNDGLTPLAMLMGDKENYNVLNAMLLISLGADPDTKDAKGWALLHYLMYKFDKFDRTRLDELVINYHATIDIKDKDGKTPLQHLLNGMFRASDAMRLIRLGANPNTKNDAGKTLIQLLASKSNIKQEKHLDYIQELKSLGATCNFDKLSNKILHELGQNYLTEYGQPSCISFLNFHTNQPIARDLKHYCEASSVQQKWAFLADQYARLPNHNGKLAKEIRYLFERAFDLRGIECKRFSVDAFANLLKIRAMSYFQEKERNAAFSQAAHCVSPELHAALAEPPPPYEAIYPPLTYSNPFLSPPVLLPNDNAQDEALQPLPLPTTVPIVMNVPFIPPQLYPDIYPPLFYSPDSQIVKAPCLGSHEEEEKKLETKPETKLETPLTTQPDIQLEAKPSSSLIMDLDEHELKTMCQENKTQLSTECELMDKQSVPLTQAHNTLFSPLQQPSLSGVLNIEDKQLNKEALLQVLSSMPVASTPLPEQEEVHNDVPCKKMLA